MKNFRRNSKLIYLVALVAFVSVFAIAQGTTHARHEIYPGISCNVFPSTDNSWGYWNGGIGLESAGYGGDVLCPIPRKTHTEMPNYVVVSVRDQNASTGQFTDFEVQFYSKNRHDSSGWWSPRVTSSGTGNQQINISGLQSDDYNVHFVYARVPRKYNGYNSRLTRLRVYYPDLIQPQ